MLIRAVLLAVVALFRLDAQERPLPPLCAPDETDAAARTGQPSVQLRAALGSSELIYESRAALLVQVPDRSASATKRVVTGMTLEQRKQD